MQKNLNSILLLQATSVAEIDAAFKIYDKYWLLLLVTNKSISLQIGFKNYKLQKNDLAIVSEDLFCRSTYMDNGAKVEIILVEENFFNSANYKLPSEFYNLVNQFPFISLKKDELQYYTSFISSCQAIFKEHFLNQQKLLSNMLNNLALISLEFWQRYRKTVKNLNQADKVTQLNREFFNLLFQKATEKHDVNYYAKALGVSHNYLTFCIKTMTNLTPKQAINKQLINEIKHLLENTNLSLKEIAWQLNFSDASYLSRFFSRYCGLSPANYREKKQKVKK